MRLFYSAAVFVAAWLGISAVFADELQLWPVDIHEKIFSDTKPGQSGSIVLCAARGEYESGQFGVCASDKAHSLSLTVSALAHENGTTLLPAESVRLRPIQTVRVNKNTPSAENTVVRQAPFDCPDILTEEKTVALALNQSQGVWVTILVPNDALEGRYTGTITLENEAISAQIPLELTVFPFTLPSERHLWVTDWFSMGSFAKVHNVPLYSEEFWPILKRYFVNMAEHRQNIVMTPWVPDNAFVKATRHSSGSWSVDFSLLERFLSLAEECGVAEQIELSHCGGVDRNKHEIFLLQAQVFDEKEGKVVSLPGDQWLEPVLGELEKWLIETGRIDRAMIHVADEPFLPDMKSWRTISETIHAAAPRLRRIDAIESLHFSGDLEIWVPKLSHYHRWQAQFDALRRENTQMWYYICCHPFGDFYPNRFMDLPGTRIRALHWINYTENLSGYLHWGYSYWQGDPFGPPTEQYGPGDTHAVYPGPLDSVRWEIERESLEDYEYFRLLEQLSEETAARAGFDLWWFDAKARGMEIARRAVHAMDDIETDPAVFAEARSDLAAEITALTGNVPLIVRTFPADNATLVTGPVVVEMYGLTAPGAQVAIEPFAFDETTGEVLEASGERVEIQANPDGTFEYHEMNGSPHALKITATLGDQTTTTVRRFKVR